MGWKHGHTVQDVQSAMGLKRCPVMAVVAGAFGRVFDLVTETR